jgi:hypothetical protein
LCHGYRFGLVASTDHHSGYPGSYGFGRLAAAATDLTREALWDAFQSRRVYAATGDRIGLDFRLNGAWMGGEVRAPAAREIAVDVRGRGALDHVELLKNERVLRRWPGPDPGRAGDYATLPRPVRALLRVEWGWGGEPSTWDCQLDLADGHILGVETCFAGPAIVAPQDDYDEPDHLPHELLACEPARCAWRSETEPNPTVRHPATQALIVEVEMPVEAGITLVANGRRYEHSLALLLEASTSHFLRGWRSEAIVLHRALPVDLCRIQESLVDDAPRRGAQGDDDCYRVRVAQRNGQWAWSSPIWVVTG